MAVRGVVPILILAALATGAASSEERRWPDALPAFVVLRTSDSVFVGADLHYENAVFRLRDGKEDVAVDEPKVARITFVRLGGENPAGPPTFVRVALRLAHPQFARPLGAFQIPEGAFILPGEPVAETFRWAARKVHQPEALALLCLDLATDCVKDHRPDTALAELERAEKETSDVQRGLVFGLMRAALLGEQGRKKEEDDAVERLKERYADHRQEIESFAHPRLRPGPFPGK